MSADQDVEVLAAQQQRLGEALCGGELIDSGELSLDPEGFKVASLLIAKLRFQRLVAASPDALRWFERDPAAFATAFRDYHQSVPLAALDPWSEAAAWMNWVSRPFQAPLRSGF